MSRAPARPERAVHSNDVYERDEYDRIVRLTTTRDDPPAPGQPPVTASYSREFDTLGRVAGVINPDLSQYAVAYDDAGMASRFTDEAGRVRELVSDRLGRTVWTREFFDPEPVVAGAYAQTRTRYDEASNIVSVADPLDQKTLVQYDGFGQATRTDYQNVNA